mgnify:CR=1 FL=1
MTNAGQNCLSAFERSSNIDAAACDGEFADRGVVLAAAQFDNRYQSVQLRAQLDENATVYDNIAEGRDFITVNGMRRHVMGYLQEFLFPFEQTAHLCGMQYLPPFAVQGTYRLSSEELSAIAARYGAMLECLALDELPVQEIRQHPYLNDCLAVRRQGAGS